MTSPRLHRRCRGRRTSTCPTQVILTWTLPTSLETRFSARRSRSQPIRLWAGSLRNRLPRIRRGSRRFCPVNASPRTSLTTYAPDSPPGWSCPTRLTPPCAPSECAPTELQRPYQPPGRRTAPLALAEPTLPPPPCADPW